MKININWVKHFAAGKNKPYLFALTSCLFLLMGNAAQAASFDCAKAAMPIEKLICSDPELSELDKTLSDLYVGVLQSKAYPDLKKSQRQWLRERNRCGEVGCLKSRYQDRITALKSPSTPPHHKLPPLDGIRHGATKEVFEKLVAEYKARPYRVFTERGGAKTDYTHDHCMDLLNALRNGKAAYVSPKFITDDYDDPRLEPYKQKYREAITKSDEEWTKIPGVDWFGGWVEERLEILRRPTRSLSIYEIDIDDDGFPEIILYGEFWVSDPPGEPGSRGGFQPMGGPSGYQIYKDFRSVGIISTPSEYDYDKQIHLSNYTTVFHYEKANYVAVSYIGKNFTKTRIEKLGRRMGANGKDPIYSGASCAFDLGKND